MTGISSYSTTASENVQANTGVDWDEGMAPGQVNNSARQNMADIRAAFDDLIWFQYGSGSKAPAPVYASGTSFTQTCTADLSSIYHPGRRIKAVGASTGTIFGTVASTSYASGSQTVNVTWDSGALVNESLTVYLSQVPVTGNPVGLIGANKIINGDMAIDQRYAGGSVTPTADNSYIVDRWKATLSVSSKFSVQQDTSGVFSAFGLQNALKITSLAATTPGSTDYYGIDQVIEGYNVADLQFGTANAAPVTVSLLIRASVAGTYGFVLFNNTASYSYPFSAALSANTPTKISVTIPGDTAHATNLTNGAGLTLRVSLGAGSSVSGATGSWQSGTFRGVTGQTNIIGTNAATLYLSGVKVESGPVPTPFVAEDYSISLSKCLRYFETQSSATTLNMSVMIAFLTYPWAQGTLFYYPKRTSSPTVFVSQPCRKLWSGAAWDRGLSSNGHLWKWCNSHGFVRDYRGFRVAF